MLIIDCSGVGANKKLLVSRMERYQRQCGILSLAKMRTVCFPFICMPCAMPCYAFCSNALLTVPEDIELVNYRKPGFLSKFIELNQVMWNTNKGLTDSHPYDSRPNVSICLATL
jgi:dolichyl-phosphate-mannose--protein O-mannosyl transferase